MAKWELLTVAQVDGAKKIYSPAINPRTGLQLFSSLVPGTELGWGVQALGPEPSVNIYDQYRYVVFKDANWDWRTFNFDRDVVRGDLPENVVMNTTDPNMKAFFSARWTARAHCAPIRRSPNTRARAASTMPPTLSAECHKS